MKSLLVLLLSICAWSCAPRTAREPDAHAVQRAQALIAQGVVAMRRDQLERAHAAFSLALETALIPEALDGLGCVAFYRGDSSGAEQLFLATVESFPEYSEGYAHLARLYELRGEARRSEAHYRQALSLDPHNFKARNNFGGYLNDNEERELARYELLKASVVAQDAVIEDNLKRVR